MAGGAESWGGSTFGHSLTTPAGPGSARYRERPVGSLSTSEEEEVLAQLKGSGEEEGDGAESPVQVGLGPKITTTTGHV